MMHRTDSDIEIGNEAAAKFATEISRECFKFEVVYVVVLTLLELVHLCVLLSAGWFDGVVLAALALRAAILGFRWRRDKVDSQPRLLTAAAGALDFLVFGLAGFVADRHLQPCAAPLSQFLASGLLAFLVLFVLPRKRSLIVAPLCVIFHAVGVITSSLARPAGTAAEREEGDVFLRELVQLFLGVVLMGGFVCLHLVAKTATERSRWQIFLVEAQQQAIRDKVQRVQEEFMSESSMRGGGSFLRRSETGFSSFPPSAEGSKGGKVDSHDVADQVSVASHNKVETPVNRHHRVIPSTASLHSAPAVLSEPAAAASVEGHCACIEGDCLPPDALVWLEGEALPRRLEEVTPGSRILCFDRLGGHLKHAAVIDARKETGRVEWAKVTLEDGTILDVTADHPVQPVAAGGSVKEPRPPVNAGALQPDNDCLMVLKVVPVKVQTVEKHSSERSRIYMTVQQPERHAVFVSTAGGRGNDHVPSVAVESANVGMQDTMRVTVSNTFLKVVEDGGGGPRLFHSTSLPAGWIEGAAPEGEDQEPRATSKFSNQWDQISEETPPSIISSGEATIILTGPLAPAWNYHGNFKTHIVGIQNSAMASQAVLSDFMGVKATGLSSVGSLRHSCNDCNVCLFENRRQHRNGKPCFKGALCERCHEGHDEYKKWKGKHLQRKRLETDGYPTLPGQTPPTPPVHLN